MVNETEESEKDKTDKLLKEQLKVEDKIQKMREKGAVLTCTSGEVTHRLINIPHGRAARQLLAHGATKGLSRAEIARLRRMGLIR